MRSTGGGADNSLNILARKIIGTNQRDRLALTGSSEETGTDEATAIETLPPFTEAGDYLQLAENGDGDLVAIWDEFGGGLGSPDGGEGDLQFNRAGAFGASPGRLTWTEGADETDSLLEVEGTIIGYSLLIETVVGTHVIQSAGAPLNIVLSDELQFNFDGGNPGDVLQSNGTGDAPTWEAPTGGSFTAEDARDTIGAALVAGNNIDITVNDAGDTITIDVESLTSADITDFNTATDERARDAVGAALTDTSSIAWTLNDAGNTISGNVLDEYVQDTVAALIVAGANISVTYNDSTPSITIAAPGAFTPGGGAWQNIPGQPLQGLTTQSGITNQEIRIRQLGEAPWAMSNVIIKINCTTQNGSPTWDEVAIFKSNGADGHNMTRLGYLDVSSIFGTTGIKTLTIPVSGVTAGDTLHFAHGCNATTRSRVRVGVADEMSVFQHTIASTRPSTMSAATTATIEPTVSTALWFYYRFT